MLGSLPEKPFFMPIVAVLGAALLIGLVSVRLWFYQSFSMPSASNEPTLNVGDYFLVSKTAYNSASPQRGDLVVFLGPDDHTYFAKRVVGVPGDSIQMRKGRLYLNRTIVPQRKVEDRKEDCDAAQPCAIAQYEESLPDHVYRVLDRMQDGPLDDTPVWTVPAGSYFMLGDNRDNSDDSRADLGFIPRSHIIGRVTYRFLTAGGLTWQPVN